MLKKLPIGIQTFSHIREENYIYVDKTEDALEVIENYKYAFLSRPRRFGKSLFLDTLRNIFEGKRELFEGLYIYDKWDWSIKYPVIKISWDGRNRSIEDLKLNTEKFIRDNQEKLGIKCEAPLSHPTCFAELIEKACKKYNQKVVVLIDEYDKPILDVIEDKEQAKEHREYIKGLYSTLKGVDEYIRFAFLTGVSKFSKASIFSGLNNLEDISLTPKFGNICGYTQNDLETTFKEYLQDANMQKIKEWYNGYNFLKDNLYNPFDILQFIRNDKVFKNYWFKSATPTFLIKLIEKNNYFLPKLSNLVVGEELVDSFDIENISLETLSGSEVYFLLKSINLNRTLRL
ncbi:AAA family ATPase [Hydrogenimonas thermophila]|uniref:Predicted AAA-ATPase n=1 Tax=Hydrogenimonas thermophila TaxID=223786 RepID=A0A1I5KQY2_9BACT|nr:AAA family ATPase [Hydrogenimonas thermophila]SFO87293.1 Predicted AAA-ATPase [Hydrogenimonas thermophila]